MAQEQPCCGGGAATATIDTNQPTLAHTAYHGRKGLNALQEGCLLDATVSSGPVQQIPTLHHAQGMVGLQVGSTACANDS